MPHPRSTPRDRASHRLLAACLLTVVLASFLASRIQSSWGQVELRSLILPTQNGQWLAADLFKPKAATAETPAPLVVVVPGFQRTKETLANISIELSRRGFVVIAIDPYAQGASSSSYSRRAATTEGYGMFAVVDYAWETNNLNYIDKTRIGATGHSAGGNAAIRGANYFGREAQEKGRESKLHSVFVSGYVLTLTEEVLAEVRSNVGISYALYDEGAYRNELENGDMRRAPEALRLVRSGGSIDSAELTEVEIGHYYGDRNDRSLRVVHNEPLLHPFQPYSWEATANQIAYFEKVFEHASGISSRNQVWHWKELLTLLSLVAGFVALVPLARLLLEGIPYFRAIVHPVPSALPAPKGKGRLLYWGLFALGALIACFSYIPMTELSQRLFVDASTRQMTWFFPQRMNNGVMLWALFNGMVGFAIFFLTYHFHGRKHGIRPEMWGVATDWKHLGRTLLLAGVLFLSFFLLLFTIYYLFHVDYRFVFMGVRPFQPSLLPLMAMYIPAFLPFFLSNSLRMNGAMRFEGDPEWRSLLMGGLANSLGLFFILLTQYVTFALTGTVFWTDGWLYINLLFAVVPIMFVLPIFHRYFFRMTGRIYLGPLTMCLIFITILLSNTVSYTPL